MKRICFLLALCSVAVASAQVVGKIEYLDGSVEIIRNGSAVKRPDIGLAIENLDRVKTGPNASLVVLFDKSSGIEGSIEVGPSASAVIRRDIVSGVTSNDVQLLTGTIGVKVSRLAGNAASFRVRTPSAVLGVRGTEFTAASFNGSTLSACAKGEVFCAPWSELPESRGLSGDGVSAVPGKMVEILEAGGFKAADFPRGDFAKNWGEVRDRWKGFQVGLVTADPVGMINRFAGQWDSSVDRLDEAGSALRGNKTLSKWLETAKHGGSLGTRAEWVKERQGVMKDLIAVKPHMTVSIIYWYRLQEILPLVSASDMDKKLSNGQTVKAFINKFNRRSEAVSSTIALFDAAEKQYMLRNDGLSPFGSFH